eukprot:1143247-Pelagomonas_calceolata.AAC.18
MYFHAMLLGVFTRRPAAQRCPAEHWWQCPKPTARIGHILERTQLWLYELCHFWVETQHIATQAQEVAYGALT